MPIVTISQQEFSQAKVCDLSLFIQNILTNLSVLIRGIWGECPVTAWRRRHSRDVSTSSRDGSRGSPLNMTGLRTIDGFKTRGTRESSAEFLH
jgi:hypothetical protein